MRILIVSEKPGTAIHRLAEQMIVSAPQHAFRHVSVHPKRPSQEQLSDFEEALRWCDVIDFRYWKTAELLHSLFDIKKPSVLTHYNPYDLDKSGWTKYKVNVVVNNTQQKTMRVPSTLIPLPIDLKYWEYQAEKGECFFDVLMVANRIEAKKGVLPVAKACKELGLKMALVGDISDPDYYDEVIQTGVVDFFHKIPDDKLRELYYQSRIHICNSIDNFESGTLPILEAMACGTPVITRRVGHVPELFNGRNMVVRKGEPTDIQNLTLHIRELLEDDTLYKEIRLEARQSLRYRNTEINARKYSQLYHHLLQEKELVSVVIPTVATPDNLLKTLAGVMSQSYGNLEIIVCDDSLDPKKNKALVESLRPMTPHTLKFFSVVQYAMDDKGEPYKTYGLARARNKAILEAEGKWIWFVDDRMLPDPTTLEKFYERRRDNVWLWGIKDGVKKSFVENLSFVKREDIIRIGMFNEQITQYGGMTQEVRTRAEKNKLTLELVSEATATTTRKSSSRWTRFDDIAKSKTQCYKLYE